MQSRNFDEKNDFSTENYLFENLGESTCTSNTLTFHDFAEIGAHLMLAAVQVGIILVVGVFVFGAEIHGNVAWIFPIALLGTIVFLNIGFILSAWARSPAAASGMGNAVALPMMFFAGTFFSTATLPWVLPQAAKFLPLTPMLEALRDVAIDSAPLWETWPQLGALGIWVAVTAFVATRVFRFG